MFSYWNSKYALHCWTMKCGCQSYWTSCPLIFIVPIEWGICNACCDCTLSCMIRVLEDVTWITIFRISWLSLYFICSSNISILASPLLLRGFGVHRFHWLKRLMVPLSPLPSSQNYWLTHFNRLRVKDILMWVAKENCFDGTGLWKLDCPSLSPDLRTVDSFFGKSEILFNWLI